MNTSRLSIALIPLATMLAIYLPFAGWLAPMPAATSPKSQAGQTASSSPQGAAERTSSNSDQPRGDSAALLCDFFGLKREERKETPRQLASLLKDKKLELLIATVPDPRDSPLSDIFDRNLDAIQRAIEAAGYLYDRASLPWLEKDEEEDSAEKNGDASHNAGAEGKKGKGGPTSPPRHTRDPGVVLFRLRGDENHLLLLFLVGETPTAGIHKFAFLEALNQMARLDHFLEPKHSGASAQSSPHEVRVIGPTFSGSGASLAIAIRQWLDSFPRDKRPTFKIISGSATSIKQDAFQNHTSHPDRVEFSTTVINNKQALYALLHYLGNPRIAMLTEATTNYGRSLDPKPTPRTNPRSAPQVNPTPQVSPTPPILYLNFPLHISQLRSASEKARAMQQPAAPPLSLHSANILPLQIDGDGEPRDKDVIPPFSRLEAVSSELVLANLFSEIKRERIQYLGLLATDVRDRVFLARAIRSHCPNVRLFTLGADLLYLHDKANLDFRGMLLVTPYPLFIQNQLWTFPFSANQSLLQFPTTGAQGCYNATLAFLAPGKMLEYGNPFDPGLDNKPRYPALWLSVVGRDGLWPVTLLKDNGSGKPPGMINSFQQVDTSDGVKRDRSPLVAVFPATFFALQLLSLFCLIPPGVLLLRLIRRHLKKSQAQVAPRSITWLEQITRGSLARVFGDEGDETYKYRFERRLYLFAACVSLLAVSLLVFGISFLPVLTRFETGSVAVTWEQKWLALPLAGCGLALIVTAILWLLASLINWMRQPGVVRQSRIEAGIIFAVGALAFVLLILITARIGYSPEEKFFFILRATNLASGVSPLAPLLFLGLAGFISFFCAVRRLNLAERMACLPPLAQAPKPCEPFLNFDHPETKSFAGLARLEDSVKRLLVCGEFSLPYWRLMILVVVLPYYYAFFLRSVPSVDGKPFDWFSRVAFLVAPLLLAFAFLRFFWLWRALRQLLRRLSLHTIFSQAPGDPDSDNRYPAFPRIDLMTPMEADATLSFSVQQAEQFWRCLPEVTKRPASEGTPALDEGLRSDLRMEMDEAKNNLSIALELEAEGEWQAALRQRNQAQRNLSQVANLIARMLEPYWSAADQSWTRQGGFFLVSHVTAFLQHIFAHLRNLVGMVTSGLLLILLAANSYPFHPKEPLLLFCWIMVLTPVAITFLIFAQMRRDKVISIISGTAPGQLNWNSDLVFRVLLHGALPVVVLLSAQFPEAVRQILDWLGALRGTSH